MDAEQDKRLVRIEERLDALLRAQDQHHAAAQRTDQRLWQVLLALAGASSVGGAVFSGVAHAATLPTWWPL